MGSDKSDRYKIGGSAHFSDSRVPEEFSNFGAIFL